MGARAERIVEILGHHINSLTGITTIGQVRGGPFDGERQLPPELEAELLEKYDLRPSPMRVLVQSITQTQFGYCRLRF
jgi:hypothetical protein